VKKAKKLVIAALLVSLCMGIIGNTVSAHTFGIGLIGGNDVLLNVYDNATGAPIYWDWYYVAPATVSQTVMASCSPGGISKPHQGTLSKVGAGPNWSQAYNNGLTTTVYTYFPYGYQGNVSA